MARSSAPPPVVEPQRNEPAVASDWDRASSVLAAEVESVEADDAGDHAWPEFLRELSPSLSPSVLGTIEARVPGQDWPKVAASLGRVQVTAKVQGGFAFTEVEEELVNGGSTDIEVIASFRAPPGGVIARMALWVEDRWIEAEVVERKRATEVYRGIVERRRDPALLEQDPSGQVKLRVFPVPPHGSRRVVVGYAQPLERQEGRYRFDLGLRLGDGVAPIRELATKVELEGALPEQLALSQPGVTVESTAHGVRLLWQGASVRPRDFRVSFAAPEEPLTTFVPAKAKGTERFVALRVTPDLAAKVVRPEASVWLIDTSVGQGGAALDMSKAVVRKLLKQLSAGERFAILACDTACTSFPRRGLAPATADARTEAQRFVAGLEARGASDLGYALFEALQRTRDRSRAQLVYFGDARPTAGDLETHEIVERLLARGELLDLRLVGVGSGLDADSLNELAASVVAARTTINGDSQEAERLVRWLSQSTLRAPSLLLPSLFEAAYPQKLPNLVQGDELVVLARLGRSPSAALSGQLSGVVDNGVAAEPRQSTLGLVLSQRPLQADTAPRLWAHARLRDLDDDDAPTAYLESVELSKRYQVLSRYTSLLALESEAMFRDLGIEPRRGRADFGLAPVVLPPAPKALRHLYGEHTIHEVRIRVAYTTVSGRLPALPIQEAVRHNDGRFRACYHDGLLRNPKLEGTVTTRFIIGRDGTVSASTDSGSTLPDRAVVACIVNAFKTVVFPAPVDGIVTVVYPFRLSPSTEKEQRFLWPYAVGEEPPLATLAPAAVAPPAPVAPPEPSPPRVTATELAAQVEQDPTDVQLQLAAARAYEAEHGERRACAHFRAAATLAPTDLATQYQALRCRARTLNERIQVMADITRRDLHSPAIDALAAHIRTLGEVPAFTDR